MEEEANTPVPEERRAYPRFTVDAPGTLSIIASPAAGIPCRVLDLSLEGCRLRTERPFIAAPDTRIEVSFKVEGIAFRIGGSTRWTEGRRLMGMVFLSVSPRRQAELKELLLELEEKLAAKAAQAGAEGEDAAAEPSIVSAGLFSVPERMSAGELEAAIGPLDPDGDAGQDAAEDVGTGAGAPPIPFPTDESRAMPLERRTQDRHRVDSRATIFLVKVRAQVHGTILDVSLGGCRIRADERLTMGIYQRVEVGFTLDGLPFRLPGVTQAIHNRFDLGIRFLDLSARKREHLSFVIQEIQEMRDLGQLPSEV